MLLEPIASQEQVKILLSLSLGASAVFTSLSCGTSLALKLQILPETLNYTIPDI